MIKVWLLLLVINSIIIKCKGLNKPKCTRTVTAHGIKLEFVLPKEMLERLKNVNTSR